jgi:hypothetical protein
VLADRNDCEGLAAVDVEAGGVVVCAEELDAAELDAGELGEDELGVAEGHVAVGKN